MKLTTPNILYLKKDVIFVRTFFWFINTNGLFRFLYLFGSWSMLYRSLSFISLQAQYRKSISHENWIRSIKKPIKTHYI